MNVDILAHEFYCDKSETLWIFPPAAVVTRADTDKPNLTHICQHATRLIAPALLSPSPDSVITITLLSPARARSLIRFKLSPHYAGNLFPGEVFPTRGDHLICYSQISEITRQWLSQTCSAHHTLSSRGET